MRSPPTPRRHAFSSPALHLICPLSPARRFFAPHLYPNRSVFSLSLSLSCFCSNNNKLQFRSSNLRFLSRTGLPARFYKQVDELIDRILVARHLLLQDCTQRNLSSPLPCLSSFEVLVLLHNAESRLLCCRTLSLFLSLPSISRRPPSRSSLFTPSSFSYAPFRNLTTQYDGRSLPPHLPVLHRLARPARDVDGEPLRPAGHSRQPRGGCPVQALYPTFCFSAEASFSFLRAPFGFSYCLISFPRSSAFPLALVAPSCFASLSRSPSPSPSLLSLFLHPFEDSSYSLFRSIISACTVWTLPV